MGCAPVSYTHLDVYKRQLYEEVAHGGLALGAQRLIFTGGPTTSTEDLKRKIAGLNTAGAFSKSLGLPLAYHNHWWEFQSKVGEIDALYSETDPALVSFLLDAGHCLLYTSTKVDFSRRAVRIHASPESS